MKTTLKLLMLLLGVSYPCIMFAGLIGIASPSAFFSGEVAFLLFAVIGLMLVGFTDYSRRPIIVHSAAAKACPVVALSPARHGHVRETRPFECAA
jgi:hypothetical protein